MADPTVAQLRADVLVAGSGIAGLTFALKAAEYSDVLLVTKKNRVDSATNYAQGGVAAVFSDEDTFLLHAGDTLLAGAGLCHRRAVEDLVREGPERVRELMEWGARFSRDDRGLSLGREAGHSIRRIVHAEDLTGREIERTLLEAVAANPRIRVLQDHFLWKLGASTDPGTLKPRVGGALVLAVAEGTWLDVRCRVALLATGGCGRLYRHTTNPEIAMGDGVAMGWEAGAAVTNLEFVQFHPTALYPTGEQAFLISEAVRGEGAVLRNVEGERFMKRFHPAGSLAPRDIVARAIDTELKRTGESFVQLDLSGIAPERVGQRFPNIVRECEGRGMRVPEQPIPVVPAAHYQCGGLLTDWDGRTSLAGLYAAGEVACTGVHGANRLASNSLLEAVVYAERAARRVEADLRSVRRVGEGTMGAPPSWSQDGEDPARVEEEVRSVMWEDVAIVRSDERLARARRKLDRLCDPELARDGTPAGAMYARQVDFGREVARLIIRCAQRRRESRGLHYTETYPHRDSERYLRDTVLAR